MLSRLNLSASVLHLCLGIGFAIYFPILNQNNKNNPNLIETSIRNHVLQLVRNPDSSVTANWLSIALQNPDISIAQILIVIFFFITSAFHFFYYYNQSVYQNVIGNQNNYFRWIEYSLTSTIMLYVISIISGVKDTKIYQLLWATNIGMIAQGQLIEYAVHKDESWWIPMITGFVLLLSEWSVVIRDYLDRVNQTNSFIEANPSETSRKTPGWITAMIFVMFLFYASFGAISLYGAYKGNTYEYEKIETLYILFSFLAKATLGFFVAFGIASRQSGSIGGSNVPLK